MKLTIAIALALALLLVGCGGSSPTETGNATLQGSVTYGASFLALTGATVTLQGHQTTTDAAGKFAFTGLTAGTATLTMSSPKIATFSDTFKLLVGANFAAYHEPGVVPTPGPTPCAGCQ